jgi:hypothetical protein
VNKDLNSVWKYLLKKEDGSYKSLVSNLKCYGATPYTVSSAKIWAILSHWHTSKRGMSFRSRGEAVVKETKYYRQYGVNELRKTRMTIMSALRYHQTYLLLMMWRVYHCIESSQAKNSNPWDWKHIKREQLLQIIFFRILPNNSSPMALNLRKILYNTYLHNGWINCRPVFCGKRYRTCVFGVSAQTSNVPLDSET